MRGSLMRRNYPILLMLPLALAACVPGAAEYTKTEAPAGLHVYGSQHTVMIAFAPGSGGLSGREAWYLEQLLRDGNIRPADRVEIAAAGAPGLAQSRVASISRELLRYGVVAKARLLAGVPPDHALIVIGQYAVTSSPCPNWSKSPATDFTNEPSSDFGCADAINLGMIVASPADLAGGRALGAAAGKPAVSAMDRYLNDRVTPLVATDLGVAPATAVATGGAPPAPATGQ
jgi:pilus assembly protein CpaD